MEWKLLTKTCCILLCLFVLASTWGPAQANPLGIPAAEYDALVALYNSTGGAGWKNSANWLTANPNWFGVTVSGGRVARLSLSSNQLAGPIPVELGNLARLTELHLGSNRLTGTIPANLGSLAYLQVLRLDNNQLTGSIPPEFSALANLQYLRLDSNKLTGSIPPGLGQLAGLQYLRLSSNKLTGSIPAELFNLTQLNDLRLDNNRLTGSIPPELRYLASLQYLDLYGNQLTGTIPTWLGVLVGLTDVHLGSNRLTGEIPASLGNLTGLRQLRLDANRLTGPIPASLGNLSQLTVLHLQNNQLDGALPAQLGSLSALTQLYLEVNKLSGAIPESFVNLTKLQNATGLSLKYNGLYAASTALQAFVSAKSSGYAPEWWRTQTVAPANVAAGQAIGGSVRLNWTPIYYAGDAGYYEVGVSSTSGGPYTFKPENRTGQKNASVITASGLQPGQNFFVVRTVTLPHPRNQNTVISAFSSEVSAAVPEQANPLGIPEGEYSALVALYNSTNGAGWTQNTNWLTQNPYWHGVTVAGGHVLAIVLPSNNLAGPLPAEIGNLTSLAVLMLQDNLLSGPIPSEIGNLTGLQTMWLGNNRLSGAIPAGIGNLTSLASLDLSWNQLSGPVPAQLGNLQGLLQLLLASNKLTGALPPALANLSGLFPSVGLTLNYNGLFTSDAALAAFVSTVSSAGGDWRANQTVAPDGFAVGQPAGSSITLTWNPIAYISDPGFYEVGISAAPGGPYTFDPAHRTGSKLGSGVAVSGLAPGNYYFVVRTVTMPHGNNQNTVTSVLSSEGTATIVGATNPLGIPDDEYDALVALYNSTDGRNWTNDTNWLTTNKLWHGVSIAGGHVTTISLAGNQLAGAIPAELGRLTELTTLNLGSNHLTGAIPPDLGELSKLQYLLLDGNQLAGEIPAEIGGLASLLSVHLGSNELTGSIPPELGRLAKLRFVDLGSNHLTGAIPPELGNLANLQQLSLMFNGLTGEIPAKLCSLSNLQSLNLQWNQISGPIPAEIGNLSNLQVLNLSSNKLTGPIPAGMGRLTNLVEVYLDRNNLSGAIPAELGSLTELNNLSLGYNQLAGAIPAEFGNLTSLRQGDGLSLAYNGLFTDDTDLAAFVSARSSSSGDWLTTQTVAPAQLAGAAPVGTSVKFSWQPILYSTDPGYYEVGFGSAAEGPFTFDAANRTSGKDADGLTVSNLPAGKLYFVVRSVTLPHALNRNTVTSAPSPPVSLIVSRPSTGTIAPSSGGVLSGSKQTFVATIVDPDGFADIADCRILLNTTLSGAGGVFLYFDVASNKIYLRNDANTAWLGGFAPGSANTIETARCIVYCGETSLTGSGTALTVNCRVLLKPVLTGKVLKEWLYVADRGRHSDGWNQAGEITPGSSVPANVSASPDSGILPTNQPLAFSTVQTDPNGFADIKASYLLINTAQNGVGAVYAMYDAAAGKLYLRDDANGAWLGGFAPGSANTIENSRARLHCAATAVAGDGDALTISWRLEFKPVMQGRKCGIWIFVADSASQTAGFDKKGEITFVVPAPANASVSPNSGLVSAARETTFTTVQTDLNGFADFKSSFLLIGSSVSGAGAVYVWYDAVENKLYLRSDDDNAWLGGFEPGSANVIENSRARVLCAATQVSGAANALTVRWRLQIKPAMLGRRCNIYLYGVDRSGLNTGFQKMGEVLFDDPPVNESLSPAGANALADGLTTILRARYTDADGYADISGAYLVLNTALSSFRAISLYYDTAANKLYLRDDLNTAWLGGVAPGQSGAFIENGYCRVDCAATTVERSGNTLQVNWSIRPKAATHGRLYRAWMYSVDAAGLTDGWDEMAAYSIGAPGLNVSLDPASATVAVGETIALRTNYWAPGGPTTMTLYLLVNTTRASAGGAYLYYEGSNNLMYLRDDANTVWLGGFAPGSANIITNGLVTVDCAASSVAMAGDQVVVRWSLKFKPEAAGRTMGAWMYSLDTTGQTDGWDEMGALTVAGQ